MWRIGTLTDGHCARMYSLLELQALPKSKVEPVIFINAKSLQHIFHSSMRLVMAANSPAKNSYECVRNGTTNPFVAVEPKGGHRIVPVTDREGNENFAAFITEFLTGLYAKAPRINLVLDNLKTHLSKFLDDVLGTRATARILRRVELHYTPKHASWLNRAEIEIGLLSRHYVSGLTCLFATSQRC